MKVFLQQDSSSDFRNKTSFLKYLNSHKKPLKNIIHIINPIALPEGAELARAQKITFESIQNALQFYSGDFKVEVVMTGFTEDKKVFPANFVALSSLQSSMQDKLPEAKGKKLPFIAEILQKTNEILHFQDDDFIIYTNIDIALQPYFYDTICAYLKAGHDALIINRRRLSKRFFDLTLTEMYAEIGYSHPGFDCFVFTKKALKNFLLEDICIGIPFLEVSLLHNILSFAENPLYVPDKHLTFHLGLDVLPDTHKAYYHHNRQTFFRKIEPHLQSKYDLLKFPYAEAPLILRAFKWGLNPGIFTRNYLELESKNQYQKIKNFFNELRWRFLER